MKALRRLLFTDMMVIKMDDIIKKYGCYVVALLICYVTSCVLLIYYVYHFVISVWMLSFLLFQCMSGSFIVGSAIRDIMIFLKK